MSSILFTPGSAFITPPMIILLALVIDALFGDPKWLYRVTPHPIALLGHLISMLEARFNIHDASKRTRFTYGAVMSVGLILLATGGGYLIAMLCGLHPIGMILLGILASSLLAWRSLYDHVYNVAVGLEESLGAGRIAISHIVGRDPKSLDESAVSRAAIESLAENFSDGTVAPVFWFGLLGLPGLCAYKAINTLDSMIGHHNERYEYFGRAAARIDDVANYVPARLTAFLIVVAACLVKGADAKAALTAMFRDAHYHRSFNAGWPEAAMAGALGIALAGPRIYDGEEVADHWMNGEGPHTVGPQHIVRALLLYRVAGGLMIAVLLLISMMIFMLS